MKTQLLLPLCLLSLLTEPAVAQSLNLSYPINYSVLQRNGSNQAIVTIAGQLTGGSSNPSNDYITWYRISALNASGGIILTGSWVGLTIQSTGQFYTTVTTNKGWYQLEVARGGLSNLTTLGIVKFGIGDVYVVAGQSNAQGVLDANNSWSTPSTNGFPEWITSINMDWGCRPDYPAVSSTFSSLSGLNRIAPTGNNSWCYAVLGKKMSEQNGGMPVAFFNAAYGGTSILNWYDSSLGNFTNSAYTGNQYCLVPGGLSSNPNYFKGQPYLTLKNTLNFYTSLFGVNAVLWHQGETDADPYANASLRTTATQTYKDLLQQVISQSRNDFGNQGLAWMIAQASFTKGGNITTSITNAQLQKGQESDKNVGPNTDISDDPNYTTINYRDINDQTHFRESANGGLTALGYEWNGKINASAPGPAGFNRIVSKPVPAITVQKSGSNRMLSVQAVPGATLYRWGSDINSTSNQGTNLTSITVPNSGGPIRCYIRDGQGNWRVSPAVYFGCPSCREASNELYAEDFGLNLNVFPNPFANELTIEFDVVQPNSDVLLEIIDSKGKIVKRLASGNHDSGHWKYPVLSMNADGSKLYFCRLKVGTVFTVKKLIKVD